MSTHMRIIAANDHEAADSADAAAAAADAAELEVIRAEVRHHAEAMVRYFNILDEYARMAAAPFGRRGGARTCRVDMVDSKLCFHCGLRVTLRVN